MARKTAKQMREEEEQLLASLSKSENTPNVEDSEPALFSNIENAKKMKNASYDEIKEYYQKNGIGKQGTFYLSAPLMKLFRTKVTAEDTKIAEVIRALLIEHYFTEDELRKIFENDTKL
jgi:hypothetical protein